MNHKPSFRAFSSLCYALQNAKLIKILKIVDELYPLNYFRADVELKSGEKICILQNVDIGVIAFATPKDEVIQLVCDPADNAEAHKLAEEVRDQFVLIATGTVRARGEGLENPKLKTGKVEVVVDKLVIENRS